MCAVTQCKKDDSQQLTSKIKKLHQHIGGCLEERLRFRAGDFADVAWRKPDDDFEQRIGESWQKTS
jgi:hypothetical protein